MASSIVWSQGARSFIGQRVSRFTTGIAKHHYKSMLRPWKSRKLSQENLNEVSFSLSVATLYHVYQVVLFNVWPEDFPFPAECFEKLDLTPDSEFYKVPKLGMHVSEGVANKLKMEW